MNRIDLRDCTIYLRDGLAGTGAIDQATAPVEGATSMTIGTVSLNTAETGQVPVGARFTVAGETAETLHTVQTRTPSNGATTSITFSPALGAGTYVDDGALTFQSQQVEINVGEGEAKWTESDEYKYDKNRGKLDTVRKGDDVPMELTIDCVFDQIKSGTSELITPIEAVKGKDAAAQWVSSSSSACEPYAVNVVIEDTRSCSSGTATYLFQDFRCEKRDYSIKNATIAMSGKCNATEPVITRQ